MRPFIATNVTDIARDARKRLLPRREHGEVVRALLPHPVLDVAGVAGGRALHDAVVAVRRVVELRVITDLATQLAVRQLDGGVSGRGRSP